MFKKRIDIFLLSAILIIALGLRLYKINTPLADWHSWRQVDTAAVARNFAEGDFNLLYPKYDDFSNVQSGQYNPEGYRFVEFPLYNAMLAVMYKYLPVLPLEIYGRLTTVVFSLIIIAILYYLVLKEYNRLAAVMTGLIYAAFPFFVYYSRVVLPETTAVAFAFLGILFVYFWSKTKGMKAHAHLAIGSIFAAASILVKPTVIFYFIPMMYLFFTQYRFRLIRKPQPYLFFLVALVPFIAWRVWINHFPAGIPGFEWLITSVNTFEGRKNIFFRPAFFRWIFFERILQLILGGYAVVFLILGILEKEKKSLLLHSIGFGALVYLFVFQGGNVQHDYYQTIAMPAIAILCGMGAASLLRKNEHHLHILLNVTVVAAIFAFSWIMSYYRIRDYYNYSEDLVSIAKVINTITPQDALIITDRDGDTTLLYLAHRKGMPNIPDTLEVLKSKGMQYLYTDKPAIAAEARKTYTPIFENSHTFIFKLEE